MKNINTIAIVQAALMLGFAIFATYCGPQIEKFWSKVVSLWIQHRLYIDKLQMYALNYARSGYSKATHRFADIDNDFDTIRLIPVVNKEAIVFVEKGTKNLVARPLYEVIYKRVNGLFVSRKTAPEFYKSNAENQVIEKVTFTSTDIGSSRLEKIKKSGLSIREVSAAKRSVVMQAKSLCIPTVPYSPCMTTVVKEVAAIRCLVEDCLTLWITEQPKQSWIDQLKTTISLIRRSNNVKKTSKSTLNQFAPHL